MEEFRYERKCLIDNMTIQEVEMLIKINGFNFTELFYERQVNNIYFDTKDNLFLHDNIIGNSSRLKVRIRWYGDTFLEAADVVLELKIKKGAVGEKRKYPLGKIAINSDLNIYSIRELFARADIPEPIQSMIQSLDFAILNRYSRKYFISENHQFRITIDKNNEYFKLYKLGNLFFNSIKEYGVIILEIKYDREHDSIAHQLISTFPFRVTKNSKYVSATLSVNF
jgi:hypothetical protein